jgi:DNA polymerase-4
MAGHAVRWLHRRSLFARTVTIKVRYSDFTTVTRSHTAPATRDETSLVARAVQLLDRTEAGRRPVRLLGVSVHNLCEEVEATDPERLPFDAEPLDRRGPEGRGGSDRARE